MRTHGPPEVRTAPPREPGFRLTGRNDGQEGIDVIHDGGRYFLDNVVARRFLRGNFLNGQVDDSRRVGAQDEADF
jgi:hypothetical protein